jgi:hypothetical protein
VRTFLIPQEGDNFRGCLPFSEPYLNITLFLKRLAKFSFRNRAVASKESSQTLQNIWSEVVYDGIKSNPNDVLVSAKNVKISGSIFMNISSHECEKTFIILRQGSEAEIETMHD